MVGVRLVVGITMRRLGGLILLTSASDPRTKKVRENERILLDVLRNSRRTYEGDLRAASHEGHHLSARYLLVFADTCAIRYVQGCAASAQINELVLLGALR